MPPFDNVLTDAQWTQKRNDTGLKKGLTSKVKLGEELKAFHRAKDAAAARKLLEKLRTYHTELKTHSGAKYFPVLNLLVEQQIKFVTQGIAEVAKAERQQMAQEALGVLNGITNAQAKVRQEVAHKAFNKLSEDDKIQRLDALCAAVKQLSAEFKGDAPIGAASQQKLGALKDRGDQLCQAIAKELADEVKMVWPDAPTLWKQSLSPLILAYLNKAIAKSNNVILKVAPEQLPTAVLKGVYDRFVQDFPKLRETMKRPDLSATKLTDLQAFKDFRLSYLQEATKLLDGEIAKVETAKADSALFQYAPLDVEVDKPQGTPTQDVSPETLTGMNRLAAELAGFKPEELAAKLYPKANALFGRSKQYDKVFKTLAGSIGSVVLGVNTALGKNPPKTNDARSQLPLLTKYVAEARDALPAEARGLKLALDQYVRVGLTQHLNQLIAAKSQT